MILQMKKKTPHNIQINDMKLILNTYVALVVNKWIWHKCMQESDTLWSGTYSWGRAKIGKFCGNWERWGRRSATFHICRQSLQKSLNSMQKLFDQLDNHLIKNKDWDEMPKKLRSYDNTSAQTKRHGEWNIVFFTFHKD